MLRREGAPKSIVIDPRRAFGRPVIVGTAVPAADVRSRFDAGDSVEELARDFDVEPQLIEDACVRRHRLPEPFVFFVDECLGRHIVPDALRGAVNEGERVEVARRGNAGSRLDPRGGCRRLGLLCEGP